MSQNVLKSILKKTSTNNSICSSVDVTDRNEQKRTNSMLSTSKSTNK